MTAPITSSLPFRVPPNAIETRSIAGLNLMAELVEIKQEGQETLAKRAALCLLWRYCQELQLPRRRGFALWRPTPPVNFPLNATAGSSLYQLKRFVEAEGPFKAAIAIGTDNPNELLAVHLQLIEVLITAQNGRCRNNCSRGDQVALSNLDDRVKAHHLLINALCKLNKYDEILPLYPIQPFLSIHKIPSSGSSKISFGQNILFPKTNSIWLKKLLHPFCRCGIFPLNIRPTCEILWQHVKRIKVKLKQLIEKVLSGKSELLSINS